RRFQYRIADRRKPTGLVLKDPVLDETQNDRSFFSNALHQWLPRWARVDWTTAVRLHGGARRRFFFPVQSAAMTVTGPLLNPRPDGEVDYIPDALLATDDHGRITYVGPRAAFTQDSALRTQHC